ncbi:MAG: hypothetical protein AAGB26_17590 [Planctomycetota bacterium]
MRLIRLILLIAIGLQPMTGLQASGMVGANEASNICCSDDCLCALSATCACHEAPVKPEPTPPTTPAPERVAVKQLLDQGDLYSYDIEPIEAWYVSAHFDAHACRTDDLETRLSRLCLWLI